jgi:hypothetical protein
VEKRDGVFVSHRATRLLNVKKIDHMTEKYLGGHSFILFTI